MKKLISLILAIILALSCGTAASALGASGQSSISSAQSKCSCSRFKVPDTEAMRFIRELKIGWNLGNTFDAYDEALSDELEYETVWCGVKTTPELIAKVKEAGFNTVRIPVSWHNHLSDDGNYTISEAWLDRVNEVVDYCIDQDMYVILNIHHDDGKDLLYPSSYKAAQSLKLIKAIWSQLADRFRDYDDHLIFESLNEPRLVGSLYEWMLLSLSPSCIDAVRQINNWNQAFVNVVRASGGNNSSRYLICPGYDASADGATSLYYRIPSDPAGNDHRIIVGVHAYTPDLFAHNSIGSSRWSSKSLIDRASVTTFMDELYYKYVSRGIPVLIDEFGAMEKNGNLSSRIDYTAFYVAAARERGMTCLWWDNNIASGSGERFGLLDRASLEWVFPGIVQAMISNA